ncbi:GWxTD domain-containing protein [Candidatus Zixiibacteriota bacterium]
MLFAEVGLWVQMLNMRSEPVTDTIPAYFGCTVRDTAEAARPDFKVFYALPIDLPPGMYQAKIIALDMYSPGDKRNFGELTMPITVRDFSSGGLLISDLKLAYDIDIIDEAADTGQVDVLVRNRHKAYPDPRGILGRNRPNLYFYGEIYNFEYEPGGENYYELGFRFLTPDSVTVKDFGKRAYKKPGTSSVLVSSLPTRDLPEGNYRLEVTVIDSVSNAWAVITKPFSVVLLSAETDSLTPEEAKRMRDVILYLAKREELETYDNLGLLGKKNFLIHFWKRFDRTPETPKNEFKDSYFNRFNYANEEYSTKISGALDGWKTDRGRIYIKYGEPDEIERYPSSLDRKPLQQWYYYQLGDQGEVYFLFEDEDGFGNYSLVHSTARGEKYDPRWEQEMRENRLIR